MALPTVPRLNSGQFAIVTTVPSHHGDLAGALGRNVVKDGDAALRHPTPDAIWANTPLAQPWMTRPPA